MTMFFVNAQAAAYARAEEIKARLQQLCGSSISWERVQNAWDAEVLRRQSTVESSSQELIFDHVRGLIARNELP